jgi:predicted enzyme related to lactoylglutathione lyase
MSPDGEGLRHDLDHSSNSVGEVRAVASATVRRMDIRIQCVVIDADDCERLARFWSQALGWRVTCQSSNEWCIEPPEGSPEVDVAPDILFVAVPDRKTVKNRLHFDLRPADQQAQVRRLTELGATRVDIGQPDDISWVVMADPEGNEFCVLAPRSTAAD